MKALITLILLTLSINTFADTWTYYSDGTSSHTDGNWTYFSDGSSAHQDGNWTYYSDGSSSHTE